MQLGQKCSSIMMRRITVLNRHLNICTKPCSNTVTHHGHPPSITVTPSVGMVDEKIKIKVHGLNSKEKVTLVASVEENGIKFESRCVYEADVHGRMDSMSDASIAGSFKGIEPMGLFWSLKCCSGQSSLLVKKDVGKPMSFDIKVYSGIHFETVPPNEPLTETKVQRLYLKPGVRRIPLTGRFKGTIFLPEGDGPFPGLVDMYGGVVSLIETRAALLASHGYATMALSYLHAHGLPDQILDADFNYIKDAYEWFIGQDYIDARRLGAVGLCFGGFLSLALTSVLPQIRAVVNINGITFTPVASTTSPIRGIKPTTEVWPKEENVFNTDEGIVITDIYECENPHPVPAWQHGAKILVIVGEDDKQVHPKWNSFFYNSCPAEFKNNIQIHRYPGAGHMIEPPYSPHARTTALGRKRMKAISFIKERFHDENLMAGGWPQEHAYAQEDSWKKILTFLDENVKTIS